MKKLLLAIFILFPCCWSSKLFAQQTNISGSVADVDTKAAIVGASCSTNRSIRLVAHSIGPIYYVSIVFDQLLN